MANIPPKEQTEEETMTKLQELANRARRALEALEECLTPLLEQGCQVALMENQCPELTWGEEGVPLKLGLEITRKKVVKL